MRGLPGELFPEDVDVDEAGEDLDLGVNEDFEADLVDQLPADEEAA